MTASQDTRPLYLRAGAEQFFALFHPAARQAQRGIAVLMCPPFGWEDVCSYRSRREWAGQLARAGFPTLRIDLPGTGDSCGSPDDDGRVAAWERAVSAAARWLSAESGCESVAAIGIGLGGMLICAAIGKDAPIDLAVLWGVPARGGTLVRELRAFERLEAARFPARPHGGSPQPAGYVRAGGFALSPETTAALEMLDLGALALPHGRPRRALLLERDGMGVDEQLKESLERASAIVRIARGAGFGTMMAEPQESRPPLAVFALVEAWLSEDALPASRSSRDRHDERPAPAPANGARKSVSAHRSAELDSAGARVLETPLFIEQPFGRLFAVLAEPAPQVLAGAGAPGAATAEVGALLLNAGAIRRIGPSRMWVEVARRWAALGIPTLRLDLEGLGDSDGDADRFADVAELYAPQFVTQVRAVLDFLEARGVARRFVLAGLCSGAYWSFHGALQDERVAAAFMLNPRTLFWDPALENIRNLRRGLLKPDSWRMILRGDVGLARIGKVARRTPHSVLANAVGRWRARGELDQLELALDELNASRKQLAFVFSENEPLHDELRRQGRLGSTKRWPNLALDLLPGGDHTLRPLYSQRSAHSALDRALQRELARLTV